MIPHWSHIDTIFAQNAPNINKIDDELFQKCPQTWKNGTIVETQLYDIAAQVQQNV